MKVANNFSHNSPLDDSCICLPTWADFSIRIRIYFQNTGRVRVELQQEYFRTIVLGPIKLLHFFSLVFSVSPHLYKYSKMGSVTGYNGRWPS